MKIGFIHFSDLFFGSGSAVLYRRILAEVSREHEVFHIIGLHRSQPSKSEIVAAYKRELPRIEPVFLPLTNALRIYYRMRFRFPFRRAAALPGRLFCSGLRTMLDKQAPDFLWWSADYLPESFSTLWAMRELLPKGARLHLSLMDPPELWPEKRKCLSLYTRCLSLAGSFDCIGDHFRDRLRAETNKPVFIINDFIESVAGGTARARATGTTVRVAITGHIYGPVELQQFLLALGQAATHSELLWFGKPYNYSVLEQLPVPRNVLVKYPGSLPREALGTALRDCHIGYLSMPMALPEFARYSVPTKLATYAEAGLPVAFHAPLDSEVHALNQTYGFGINLATDGTGSDGLRKLLNEPEPFASGLRLLGQERFLKERVLATVRTILMGGERDG